jgi:DNA-binding NarL/FixJ family response regulator
VAIRVLIVDDHPVVCEGFTQLFEFVDGIDPVGTAGTGEEAMDLVPDTRPDVVLVDLNLGGEDGIVVATRIRKSHPDPRIVIFTAGAMPDDIRRARAAGVDGVLLKTMPVGDLIRAIKEVAEGRDVIDRDLVGMVPTQSPDGSNVVPLSEREMEVLTYLAKGMSNKELAAALFISRATVKSHIENILRKLEASDRAAAVAEGFRRGLLRT